MKIRQCFLKLQLKMSGMFFFETHCRCYISRTTWPAPRRSTVVVRLMFTMQLSTEFSVAPASLTTVKSRFH